MGLKHSSHQKELREAGWHTRGYLPHFDGAIFAQSRSEDHFTVLNVADGVYAAIAKAGGLATGNAGFVVGDGGVLLFDAFLTPVAVTHLVRFIDSEMKKAVRFAVNSHYHFGPHGR